jgi:hypothetical protein
MSEEPLTEVVLTQNTIACTRPNGDIQEVQFDDLVRVEVQTTGGELVVAALVQPGTGAYRLPPWVREKATDKRLRWRVVALDVRGRATGSSGWRSITLGDRQ